MTTSYEKQLEKRVEQLEQQLQESEKQKVRDFDILKERILESFNGRRNGFSWDPGHTHLDIDREFIELLEDEDIRETFERHIKEIEKNMPRFKHNGRHTTLPWRGYTIKGL